MNYKDKKLFEMSKMPQNAKVAIKKYFSDMSRDIPEYFTWYVYDEWHLIEAFTELGESWGIVEVGDCEILVEETLTDVKRALLKGKNAADDYLHGEGAAMFEEVLIFNNNAS